MNLQIGSSFPLVDSTNYSFQLPHTLRAQTQSFARRHFMQYLTPIFLHVKYVERLTISPHHQFSYPWFHTSTIYCYLKKRQTQTSPTRKIIIFHYKMKSATMTCVIQSSYSSQLLHRYH